MRVIHNGVKSGKLDTCHCRHGTSKNSIWKTRLYFLTTCFKENQRLIICNIWTQLRKMHCAQLLSHVQLFPNPWTVDTRLLCPWDFSGKNTRVDCHFLLQGIFPTQESNLGLLHHREILHCLSRQGSPGILEWAAYPFSRGSCWPRNQTRLSWIAGGFFTRRATREAQERWSTVKIIIIDSILFFHLIFTDSLHNKANFC